MQLPQTNRQLAGSASDPGTPECVSGGRAASLGSTLTRGAGAGAGWRHRPPSFDRWVPACPGLTPRGEGTDCHPASSPDLCSSRWPCGGLGGRLCCSQSHVSSSRLLAQDSGGVSSRLGCGSEAGWLLGGAYVSHKHGTAFAAAAPGLLFGRSSGPQSGSEASSRCFCVAGIWF